MDILLHICCAPCALYTVDRLKQEGHNVEGFFYNPNIYPLAEYKQRRQGVTEMAKRMNLSVNYQDDQQTQRAVRSQGRSGRSSGGPHSENIFAPPSLRDGGPSCKNLLSPAHVQPAVSAKSQRCVNCWRMRLSETARAAKAQGADAFSTTLLISPYQDHYQLKNIGDSLAGDGETSFYYEDFRTGFRKSQQMAKELGIYRQKYCGCELSKEEK